VENFRLEYSKMINSVLDFKLPTTLCTIYNPNFPDPTFQQVASTGLCSLNDVILSQAISIGLPVIDLKNMFKESKYYANSIEPSEIGGDKITDAIVNTLLYHDFKANKTSIYV